MAKTIRLKITGGVALANRQPGEEFDVAVDDDGVVLDKYWRRRLAEADTFGSTFVSRVKSAASEPPAPATKTSKASKE